MENYQKVEQLVNKTGCSYVEAKAALEACAWDMLDAVINLEKEGKINKETARVEAETPVEITPEVSSEKVAGSNSQQITYRIEEGAGGSNDNAGSSGKAKGARRAGRLWNRIKRIMMNNRMVVIKSNGQQIMNVPIIAPIIALLAFFWLTLILAIAAMAFGCRFHFEGEDLGKTGINNTMDKATDYAEKVKGNLTKKAKDEQNTDR